MSSSSSSSISQVSAPPWVELPQELTAAILSKLGIVEILTTAQKVCKTWRRVCRDPAMWRRIDFRQGELELGLDMEKMCRRAVDLSQGQLTEISIHHFGSDHLLLYIAQRSSQLTSLELACAPDVTGSALSEAVKFWTSLEQLHLYDTFVKEEDIEKIGRFCPLLTSFKLNSHSVRDEEALAIARNMPQLCHLQLIGSKIANEGVEAILDGCPRLKSLDLRNCLNVRLVGNFESSLLSHRIKDLRLPSDSMDDYPFALLEILLTAFESSRLHYDDGYLEDIDFYY